jgi:hypothetical protein
MNDITVERCPMYVRSVAKLSFGRVIFEDMNESTLVKNPMNASNVENPLFVLVPLRSI